MRKEKEKKKQKRIRGQRKETGERKQRTQIGWKKGEIKMCSIPMPIVGSCPHTWPSLSQDLS